MPNMVFVDRINCHQESHFPRYVILSLVYEERPDSESLTTGAAVSAVLVAEPALRAGSIPRAVEF